MWAHNASWKRWFLQALWLACTAVGERWERNKWNLMCFQNKIQRQICNMPIKPMESRKLPPLPSPASSLLRLTYKVSFYCRVNSSDQTGHPGLVQPKQTQQAALEPGLLCCCIRNRINHWRNPLSLNSHLFSLIHPASTNKPHSWAVPSSLCFRLYLNITGYSTHSKTSSSPSPTTLQK